MFDTFSAMEVNYLAILVCGVMSLVLGSVWYSPLMFGKKWMKYAGFTEADAKNCKKSEMARMYICTFVAALITAYVMNYFLFLIGSDTAVAGAEVGVLAWFGFVATGAFSSVLFEKTKFGHYLINIGYTLVQFVIMGMILAGWHM